MIKIKCDKIVIVERSDIIIDPKKLMRNRALKIILYEVEHVRKKYRLKFYDMLSNSNFIMEVNAKNKIKIIGGGSF